MRKNKIRLYFRSKHSKDNVFSSEIFDNYTGEVNVVNTDDFYNDKNKTVTIKRYHNINDILNDDTFTVFTDDSFTQQELHMMQDIIYAHGRHIYGNERVNTLVHKIERLLLTGCYLPENKNEIIKK